MHDIFFVFFDLSEHFFLLCELHFFLSLVSPFSLISTLHFYITAPSLVFLLSNLTSFYYCISYFLTSAFLSPPTPSLFLSQFSFPLHLLFITAFLPHLNVPALFLCLPEFPIFILFTWLHLLTALHLLPVYLNYIFSTPSPFFWTSLSHHIILLH